MIDSHAVQDMLRALDEFGRAQREIGARLARSMDLPRAGIGILRYLYATAEPVSVGCAAQHLRVDLSVASRQVSALVDAGLVRRTVDDGDRRSRSIELTDLGHARVDELKEHITVLMTDMFADWEPHELSAATDHMAALARTIADHHNELPASLQVKETFDAKEPV
ncbi:MULTISPECIES: MarR family winged helix-turn-helix transcriptional regulator [Sanguibacter]|mgnify:FL=1|nr:MULTISPECIES: MarR family transcriptional regulator [Sanguibacter]